MDEQYIDSLCEALQWESWCMDSALCKKSKERNSKPHGYDFESLMHRSRRLKYCESDSVVVWLDRQQQGAIMACFGDTNRQSYDFDEFGRNSEFSFYMTGAEENLQAVMDMFAKDPESFDAFSKRIVGEVKPYPFGDKKEMVNLACRLRHIHIFTHEGGRHLRKNIDTDIWEDYEPELHPPFPKAIVAEKPKEKEEYRLEPEPEKPRGCLAGLVAAIFG